LAVSRRGPGFSVDVSEWSKVPFSGGPEWQKINAGRRFRRNWISRRSNNLSCRTSPPEAAVPLEFFAPERGAKLGVTRRAARAVALADLDPELHRLPLGIPAGVLGKVKNMVPDRAISSANVL
jgi:hypothetical protein